LWHSDGSSWTSRPHCLQANLLLKHIRRAVSHALTDCSASAVLKPRGLAAP
jgi:hypothetical protein